MGPSQDRHDSLAKGEVARIIRQVIFATHLSIWVSLSID